MTRIASYASNTLLLSYISDTNRRLQDQQVQLTTNKKSQTYSGISVESQRLVTFENTHASLNRFINNNQTAAMRLDITATAVTAMRTTIGDFEKELQQYQSAVTKDQATVNKLQAAAFRGLVSITSYLNTEADGRFVFAGGRVDTAPAELPFSTLAQFQETFNGSTVTYPTTRDAHLENFSLSADGNDQTNWLTFQRSNLASPPKSRITATTAQFANVAVGAKITVSGTTSNNGTYTVAAVGGSGTYIDVVTEMLTDEAAVPVTVTYPDPNQANVTLSLNDSAAFNRAGDTITYSGGALAAIPAGSTFTVAGSASNNGTYTVKTNSGGVITIVASKLTDEGAKSYYANTAGNSFTFTNNVPAATDTIAGPAGTFSALSAGMQVTLKGTAGGTYDGTYTVNAVAGDGSSITIDENLPAATASEATPAITFLSPVTPYFNFTSGASDITFTNNTAPTKDTIATVAGDFSALKPGMKVWLTGGAGVNGNNDTYTVDSVSSDGKTITIRENLPAVTATDANAIRFLVPQDPGTIAADAYYNGDSLTLSHRSSASREIDWELNAASAVFEKAIRAMGLIAQGAYKSEGGIDQNSTRVSQALYLTRSSLYVTAQGSPPFGAEQTGSIESTQQDLGFKQVLLKETNEFHKTYRSYLETNMARIENVDRNEVVTRILDDTRVLEASYQTLARIRQLSLVNFL